MLGFIHYQLIINLLRSLIRSIEALSFPKKLVFRVGKKALTDRQALLQFLVANRLVRIANVLDCVGRVFILFYIGNIFSGKNHLFKVAKAESDNSCVNNTANLFFGLEHET